MIKALPTSNCPPQNTNDILSCLGIQRWQLRQSARSFLLLFDSLPLSSQETQLLQQVLHYYDVSMEQCDRQRAEVLQENLQRYSLIIGFGIKLPLEEKKVKVILCPSLAECIDSPQSKRTLWLTLLPLGE